MSMRCGFSLGDAAHETRGGKEPVRGCFTVQYQNVW